MGNKTVIFYFLVFFALLWIQTIIVIPGLLTETQMPIETFGVAEINAVTQPEELATSTITPTPTLTESPTSTPFPTPTRYFLQFATLCPPEATFDVNGQCCPYNYTVDSTTGHCVPSLPVSEDVPAPTPRHGLWIAFFLPVSMLGISFIWGELAADTYQQPKKVLLNPMTVMTQDGLQTELIIFMTARKELTLKSMRVTWRQIQEYANKAILQEITQLALHYYSLEDLEQSLGEIASQGLPRFDIPPTPGISSKLLDAPIAQDLLVSLGIQVLHFDIQTRYPPKTLELLERKAKASAGGTAYLAYAAAAQLNPDSAESRELYRIFMESGSQQKPKQRIAKAWVEGTAYQTFVKAAMIDPYSRESITLFQTIQTRFGEHKSLDAQTVGEAYLAFAVAIGLDPESYECRDHWRIFLDAIDQIDINSIVSIAKSGGEAYLAFAAAAGLDPRSVESRQLYTVFLETLGQIDPHQRVADASVGGKAYLAFAEAAHLNPASPECRELFITFLTIAGPVDAQQRIIDVQAGGRAYREFVSAANLNAESPESRELFKIYLEASQEVDTDLIVANASAGGTAYLAYAAAAHLNPDSAESRELYAIFLATGGLADVEKKVAEASMAGKAYLAKRNVKKRVNPYIVGDVIRQTDMYFGREDVKRRILNALPDNHVAVHGPRRIGKTSLLYLLRTELSAVQYPGFFVLPIFYDFQTGTAETLFHRLMTAIADVCRNFISLEKPLQIDESQAVNYDDLAFRRDLRGLVKALKNIASGEVRMILLMDEGDILNNYPIEIQRSFRGIFMSEVGRVLKMVWAGVEIQRSTSDVSSPWHNLFVEIPLGSISDEAAYELIEAPANLSGYQFNSEAIKKILDYSLNLPHRIQLVCWHATEIMLDSERTNVEVADVEQAIVQVQRKLSRE